LEETRGISRRFPAVEDFFLAFIDNLVLLAHILEQKIVANGSPENKAGLQNKPKN
jgi:hypothetical protein